MRLTKTWTISLPPELSAIAGRLAREEHRTKSELVREALRCYLEQCHAPLSSGASERLSHVGELAAFYRERHGRSAENEAELRRAFQGIRRLHDRLASRHDRS